MTKVKIEVFKKDGDSFVIEREVQAFNTITFGAGIIPLKEVAFQARALGFKSARIIEWE